MYLGRIQGRNISLLQSMVRFPCVPTFDAWWASYQRRMAALPGLPTIASSYRFRVSEDGTVDRLFSAVFEQRQEQAARRFFGGFAFLEGFDDRSVVLPANNAEFESWAANFPKLRCRVMAPSLKTANEIWFACDFRVGPHLEMIQREAQSLGFAFSYQVHFRPYTPDPEVYRRIGRNLIALQSMRGAPADLVDDQERQMRTFASAAFLVEEIVGVDEAESANWLADALSRAFRFNRSRAKMETPSFEFISGDCGTDTTLMMHSTLLYGDWIGDDVYCSNVTDEQYRLSVFSHRPAVHPSGTNGAVDPGGGSEAIEPPPTPFPSGITLPNPFEGRDHIFVSYRRSDLRRIVPILQRLADKGYPIWYDRGISGGDEWDVVLERKIEEAAMMLVFLSQATVDSKYCRREIKFADAIDKPLLVVMLEATALRHGLKLLLHQLQNISAADQQFDAQLDHAIDNLLARA